MELSTKTTPNIYIEGNGNIAIIFMAGSGITSPILEYKALYSKLSDEYKIAVIEKPGYGFSGPMSTKRTVENMVEESRTALAKAGVNPPYVLAPHSYSGLEAVYWANNYPDEVVAMIGIDMVFPNFALAQGEEISQDKKIAMVKKQKKMMTTIAKQGLISNMFKKKTVDASGLMSGNILSESEKKIYNELYYKNITNEEVFEESILATENAQKASGGGVIKCPACFFISNMRGMVKRITWQDAGKEYAQQCGGEVHMTDRGHMFYNFIPDEVARTIKDFLEKLKL